MPTQYVPVANTVQAELRFELIGQAVENVLYFEGATGIDLSEMAALGEGLWNWWAENMSPHSVDDLILREVYLTDLTTQTSPTYSYAPAVSENGQVTTEPMPNSTALVVSFRTVSRGRSSRGRNYVSGMSVDQVNGNVFAPTYVSAVLAAYTLLNQPSYIPGWTQVVVSRFSGGNPRVTGLRQIVQNCVVTSASVKTQRGRLPE